MEQNTLFLVCVLYVTNIYNIVPYSAGSSWLQLSPTLLQFQYNLSRLLSSVQSLQPVMTDMWSMTHTDTHCTLTLTSSHTNLKYVGAII